MARHLRLLDLLQRAGSHCASVGRENFTLGAATFSFSLAKTPAPHCIAAELALWGRESGSLLGRAQQNAEARRGCLHSDASRPRTSLKEEVLERLDRQSVNFCGSCAHWPGGGRTRSPVAEEQHADRCCDKHSEVKQKNEDRRRCRPVVRAENL